MKLHPFSQQTSKLEVGPLELNLMVGLRGYLQYFVMTREAKTNDSTDPELEMSSDWRECHSRQILLYH